MAGNAKTNKFFFSAASVLVAKQADFLTLNEAAHSLGLIKDVAVNSDPQIVDLTQGIMNDVIDQQVTGNNIQTSMSVHEYTARNLAYGLALDGTLTSYDEVATSPLALAAQVAAAATTLTVPTDVTTQYTAGKFIFLQEGTDSVVHIAKVASSAYSSPNTTITFTGYPVPAGMTFSVANGRVGLLNKIDYDPNAIQQFHCARIIGTEKNTKRPFIIHFPKIKILKGFNVRFATDNFGSMPFEFSCYTPLAADVGYSADFPQKMHITKG
jgi:hypothetical protein